MITNYRLFKEAKKLLKTLGFDYISYHACPNDCILYRGEYGDKEMCPKCGHDRYDKSKNKGNQVLVLLLRY